MLNPILIEPERFALDGDVFAQTVSLSQLDERVSQHEYFAQTDTDINVCIRGGKDALQRPCLDLTLSAQLWLVCQRCVKPVAYALDEAVRLVVFANEAALDSAMMADEDIEGIVASEPCNLWDLVEDQILMALPYAPRHEDCDNEVIDALNQDKPNPFAVLAGLKSNS